MITLKSAVATVHKDQFWWRKVLIGGALWLTIVGYPIVEGFQLESIENTEKGFSAPLPRWDMLGTKLTLGIFAAVIDFFFFFFPLILIGLLLLCSAFVMSVAGLSIIRSFGSITIVFVVGWLAVAWFSSTSPIAKRLYAIEGHLERALSMQVLRNAWRQPVRGPYLRARLQSLPLYIIPLALFASASAVASASGWLALMLIWLGLSALFYTHLVVIQLYASAAKEVVRLNFEALQRRSQL